MEVVVRPLDGKDAWEFRECKIEAVKNCPSAFVSSPEEEESQTLQDSVDQLSPKNESVNVTFGAFVEDKLVGIATTYRLHYRKKVHKLFVSGMYVRPAYRGKKIGAQLLSAIVHHGRSLGTIKRIELAVESKNDTAKRLYISAGFERWGTEPETFTIDGRFCDADYLSLKI